MKNICTNCSTENSNTSKYCSVCGYKLENFTENNIQTENKKTEIIKDTKKKSKKAIIGSVIGFVVGFIIMFSFFVLPKFLSNDDTNAEKAIAKIVNELNEMCPMAIDEYTTLDNVTALPSKTIQYNYTLGFELSEVNVDELKNTVYPNTINYVKNAPDMKIYRDNKVTFIYFYKDINSDLIMEWTITPDLYK